MKLSFLSPWLVLSCGTFVACLVQDDPLAKPYFDIPIPKQTISSTQAQLLQSQVQNELKYRTLSNGKEKFLCAIPNVTTTKATPTHEERMKLAAAVKEESARASLRGQELLSGTQGTCLFWLAGWWTYRFCYGDAITQFHALPPTPGIPIFPPRPDPAAGVYTLGKLVTDTQREDEIEQYSIFQNSGDSKSLVMQYTKGTYCPLIGAERKTEVQFQCSPITDDRIVSIKEVSSCQYLIIIQTARLCHDVAFRESVREPSNEIICSRIGDEQMLPELDQIAPISHPSDASAVDDNLILEEAEERRIDERTEGELSHLSFGEVPEELADMVRVAPKSESSTEPKHEDTIPGEKAKQAANQDIAQDIADQFGDGTLQVNGQSIFDTKNENIEFDVELQDEHGELLGSVVMKVVDGEVVINMGDGQGEQGSEPLSVEGQDTQQQQQQQQPVPGHLQAVFDRFVGRDEL